MNSSPSADLLESDKLEERTHSHRYTHTGPSRVVKELPSSLQTTRGKSESAWIPLGSHQIAQSEMQLSAL